MRKIPFRFQWLLLVAGFATLMLTFPVLAADFTKYHNHDELTTALEQLAEQHGKLARLIEIGKSRGGRALWVLELANLEGQPLSERPGLFLGANFEGNQLFGSELALFTADYFLNSYSSNEEVKKILDSHVLYVLPRANPDGAEKMFADLKIGEKTNTSPYDSDNDGRVDEDGYEDLNGDGLISVMRVADPSGEFMLLPEEKRLMKKADPSKGEAGIYKVYWEGIDNDKDGFINEDPSGGVDINRNFQHKYPYYSEAAGPHMVSESETRAILDFMLTHRNIALILTFGESDNLVTPPNSRGELEGSSVIDLFTFADQSLSEAGKVGMFQIEPNSNRFRFFMGQSSRSQTGSSRPRRPVRMPEEKVNTDDIPYFKMVSDKYREITEIKNTSEVRVPAGAFFEYGYYQYGILAFSTPGWGIPIPERKRETERENSTVNEAVPAQRAAQRPPARRGSGARSPGSGNRPGGAPQGQSASSGDASYDVRLLNWMESEKIDGFVEWSTFTHPDLGEVEIGGFEPGKASNPPIDKINDLGPKHCEFVKYISTLFPKVSIAKTKVINLGAGLFKIEAEIENSGYLPTVLAHGVVSRSVKPTMVQLGIAPEDLVSGDAKTSFFQALAGSGSRNDFTWIVKSDPGKEITLKVVAQKGGTESVTLTLN